MRLSALLVLLGSSRPWWCRPPPGRRLRSSSGRASFPTIPRGGRSAGTRRTLAWNWSSGSVTLSSYSGYVLGVQVRF